MSWYIEYSHTDSGPKRIRLDAGSKLTIGRGSDSDTKIPDPALSRVHCEVSLQNDQPVLADLGSSVGTFVGKQRIERQALQAGESFQAGNTRFTVVLESALDAPTRMVTRPVSNHAELIEKLQKKGRLDRFTLGRLVNKTGRNLVFQAIDSENDKTVAIKVLPAPESSEEEVARFLRAMRLLQNIRDRHLVQLFRAGRRTNYCWVAMEWFEHGAIADRVAKQGISNCLGWKDVWRVASSIANSLGTLEREGIVHRSIRPTNILYRSSDDSWVLSDLVVAKAEVTSADNLVTRQTFLPTDLAYTAPERLQGSELKEHSLQADIYSLGAVLCELLTGEPPYGRGSLADLLPRLKGERRLVTRNDQLGLNEMFLDLVNRLTEPDPDKRMETAEQLAEEVQRVGILSGMSTV